MKQVVITGVSTGIGHAAAATLIERGYHVFGSVRREEDAVRLQSSWGAPFTPLRFDVTDEDAVHTAAEEVATKVGERGLFGLVNNAGIAVAGPAMHLPLDDYRRQFEVNVIGQIGVIQAFLPLLGAGNPCPHPRGRIVNISSVSGRIAYPFLSPYAASKHALEAISDSLRRELMIYGIDVIVVEPGAVSTPIWDKARPEDGARFAGSDYEDILAPLLARMQAMGRNAERPDRVVSAIVDALESRRPKARYALPANRVTGWWLPRWLPTRWFDRLAAKRLGLVK